jgi:arylsulfatase A-like enzyme
MVEFNKIGRVASLCVLAGGVLMARGLFAAQTAGGAGIEKPNIIFILTDDQGYGDIGRHGHPVLESPHMDQMYDESVRFDHFYVSPSCSPTRAALLTGMHEFRNGVTHTLEPREHLFKDAVTLPDILKTAGYKTGWIGKWHLSYRPGYAPHQRGFDWTATNQEGPRDHFDVEIIRNNQRIPTKGFREDVYFDEAMTFIDEAGDQPFFLYLCTYSPHTPLDAPEDLIAKYTAKGLNKTHATYLAMVENIDQNLGRLNAFLKKRDLEENTIVIFMNDNGVTEGLDVYNAGMRGCKATVWQGGTRAMSFWKWPGTWEPKTVDNLTAHLDVLPTLCELAGAEIPEKVQDELEGFSLMPLLNGKSWEHDNRYLFQNVGRWPSGTAASHKYAMCAVRKGDYLLVRSAECEDPVCGHFQSQCTTMRAVRKGLTTTTYAYGTAQEHWGVTAPGHWMLVDVKKDPGCKNDLSKMHPELVSELIAAYDTWWDDQYPLMIARGGDAGDPQESAKAAALARKVKAAVAARKVADAPATNDAKKPASMFKRMDANGDGQVTEAEYVAFFKRNYAARDTNEDGVLSAEEFPFPAFDHADTNQDGALSPAEYEALYQRQFKERDANGDGTLTIDEM